MTKRKIKVQTAAGAIDVDLNKLAIDPSGQPGGIKEVTKVAPALARGAEGKPSVHSRRSLDEQRGRTKPRQEPEVAIAKVVKAGKATRKAKPAGRAAPGTKLSLKQNKEVRALLTAAAVAAGGTRLTPIGFTNYSEFLNGVPLDKDGNALVVFIPVKGSAPIQGKNVKLTIKAGKVVKVA